MNIFYSDLLKNKFFLIIVAIVILIGAFIYFKDYNSIENQCQRKWAGYSSSYKDLRGTLINTTIEDLIRECIQKGNK